MYMYKILQIISVKLFFQYFIIIAFITLTCHHMILGQLYTNEFAIQLIGDDHAAENVAKKYGFINRGQIGSLKGYYLFEHHHIQKRSLEPSLHHNQLLQNDNAVLWVKQQHVKHRVKRSNFVSESDFPTPPDPLYPNQWFLHGGGRGGYDMNVVPAWIAGYTGKGVVVSILDDGIQTNHPDLMQNYDQKASLDINGQDDDPTPQDNGDNKHGTRCAGEVAAVAFNEFCGVGVAYNASIGGVRMLDGTVTDATEATALSHNPDHIHIYSASWGPEDDGKTVDGPGPLAKLAFSVGIKKGRSGLGSIFVWASGNGGRYGDSCNCDGYTNSIYTLSISSATQAGTMPWYLEQCSSTLATTYSSGTINRDESITTVDMDNTYFRDMKRNRRPNPMNLCTKSHTGTSASAPIAAAICALALEANHNLTWRDMQYLVVITSRPEPLMQEDGWVPNGVGRFVSSKFGYGLMDAAAMVKLAKKWQTVPPQHICETLPDTTERIIPSSVGGRLEVTMNASDCQSTENAVLFLEHVQVNVTLYYKPRGNLRIVLVSPAGTPSTILLPRPHDIHEGSFNSWPFMSVHFWGEKPSGLWKMIIFNDGENESRQPGKLAQWSLIFYGTESEPMNLQQTKRTEYRSPKLVTNQNQEFLLQSSVQPFKNNMNNCFLRKKFQITTNDYTRCMDRCPPGQYGDLKDYMCHLCDKSCQSCYGPSYYNCLTCSEKTFLSKSLCVKICPDGYYADNESQKCMPCSDLCLSCQFRPDFCISCKSQMYLHDHTCLSSCPIGTFATKSVCQSCNSLCKTCFGSNESECIECLPGQYLFNSSCVVLCPKGYFDDGKKCIRCHHSCETCNNENSCASCQPEWNIDSSELCVLQTQCKNGWYNTVSGSCDSCVNNCSHCTNLEFKACIHCLKGFYWLENSCVESCPSGFYPDSNGECRKCSKMCKSCTKEVNEICLTCEEGFYLHNQKCIVNCPPGYYGDQQGYCQICSSSCLYCKGGTSSDCTTCFPRFYLLNNKCHKSCPHGTYAATLSNNERLECALCYHLCKTCSGFGPMECISCYENSTFSDGTCIPCLDDEYFDTNSKECHRCHDKCGRCDGPSEYNCLSCQAPLRLDKSSHSCLTCCSKKENEVSKCCACSKNLDICINSADHPRSIYGQMYDSDEQNEVVIPMEHVLPVIVAICASVVLLFVLLFAILQAISAGWCHLNFYGKSYKRVPNHLAARFDAEMEKVSLTQDCPDDDDDIYEKA